MSRPNGLRCLAGINIGQRTDYHIREFFFNISGDFYWDLSGRLETRKIIMVPIYLHTESGDQIIFDIGSNLDVLPYNFEVAKGVVLPAGSYNFTNYRFRFNSASYRAAVIGLSWRFGRFYSGHLDNVGVSLRLKYKGYATISLDTNLVRGRLPQGHFNKNVYKIKTDLFLSPDLSLMNYIQYDNVSCKLGWSTRFHWQISPGNEIFIVYNKNWEKRLYPTSRFFPLLEHYVLKISFSIRP